MKKIECIIPAKRYAELERVLRGVGIGGITVTEVKGFGNEQTRPEPFLLLPKTKVEVFCRDEELEDLLAVISNTCKSGSLGDGKVAVYEVSDMIRIRTGERGEVAV